MFNKVSLSWSIHFETLPKDKTHLRLKSNFLCGSLVITLAKWEVQGLVSSKDILFTKGCFYIVSTYINRQYFDGLNFSTD